MISNKLQLTIKAKRQKEENDNHQYCYCTIKETRRKLLLKSVTKLKNNLT